MYYDQRVVSELTLSRDARAISPKDLSPTHRSPVHAIRVETRGLSKACRSHSSTVGCRVFASKHERPNPKRHYDAE